MSDSLVLDSFALLALLRDEPGGEAVRDLLTQAAEGEITLLMSEINLGEVLYHTERKYGVDEASQTLVEIEVLPIQLVGVTRARVLAAAHLKANYRISYADAFAAALVQEYGATLVTGDPEFRSLGDKVRVEWLGR
jgi:ribonuclease VapC